MKRDERSSHLCVSRHKLSSVKPMTMRLFRDNLRPLGVSISLIVWKSRRTDLFIFFIKFSMYNFFYDIEHFQKNDDTIATRVSFRKKRSLQAILVIFLILNSYRKRFIYWESYWTMFHPSWIKIKGNRIIDWSSISSIWTPSSTLKRMQSKEWNLLLRAFAMRLIIFYESLRWQ
jgi:hypothetical protein